MVNWTNYTVSKKRQWCSTL